MGAGGAEHQVLQLLRHIDRKRFVPHLYLMERRGEWLDRIPDDVPVASYWPEHPPPRVYVPGRILCQQAQDVRRHVEQWRIDRIYDRTSQMTLTAYLAGRPKQTARLSVAAGDPQREFQKAHRRFALVKRWLLRRAYHDADRVIAVCEAVRQGLVRFFGLPPDHVVTLYPIVDRHEVALRADEFVPERDPNSYYLVTVGRLEHEKGQRLLLEAMARLVHPNDPPPIRLWLIGSGPDEPALKKLAVALRVENRVEFLGYRPNPLPWVKHADLYCCPSHYEGMPNAVLEAMLCGTPVVAADSPGGLAELLAHGRGLLVKPNTAGAWAQAIAAAREDLPRTRQKAIQAQQWACSRFDADRQVRRLEELLENVDMPWPVDFV